LYSFLSVQAENETVIEKLMNENLDGDGAPLPEAVRKRKRSGIEAFDISKYV
jgi:methanogenic corrinoid protein MtbC1